MATLFDNTILVKSKNGEFFCGPEASSLVLDMNLKAKLSVPHYFDPNDDVDEDERTRISLLTENFLSQYFQVCLE